MRKLDPHRLETGRPVVQSDAGPVPPMLSALFDAFSRAGVQWCLLRGESDLTAQGEDVDLLVARHHRLLAEREAVERGFARLTALGRGSHQFFIGYDPPNDRWVKLDVVSDLRFGPYQTLRWDAEAECLARRNRIGDVFVLSPSDGFWTLLLHCLLDKGRIAPRHRARLEQLAAEGQIAGPAAVSLPRRVLPAGWDPADLVRRVLEGDWSELESLAPSLSSGLMRAQLPSAVIRRAVNGGLRRLTRLALLGRRGLAVALIGPDGSGKSTVAAAILEHFFLPVRVVYMGIHLRASPGRASRPIPLPARVPVNWGRYLTAELHEARGRLVIFDRYPFDALLPPSRPVGPLRRAGRWMIAHACPKPDVVVLLDAPAAVMHRRKGDHSIEVLEHRRRQYLELASRLGEVRVVDASQALDDVRRRVTTLIWDEYRCRRHGSPSTPKSGAP